MSAIDDYPRDLSLTMRHGRHVLEIHAPDLSGEVASSSPQAVADLAEVYAAWRRGQQDGPLVLKPGEFDAARHAHGVLHGGKT